MRVAPFSPTKSYIREAELRITKALNPTVISSSPVHIRSDERRYLNKRNTGAFKLNRVY